MYFDAGTGSLIIQAVVAGLAVLGGYFAIFRTRLKGFFHKKKDADEEPINTDKSSDKGSEEDDEEF